jgi:adenylylsulfate kinase
MIIQLCGLSGAGKSTLALNVKEKLVKSGRDVEIIDGDDYRRTLCKDLGFSKEDRFENISRLAFVASKLSAHGIIVIISAINPFEHMRRLVARTYPNVKTVYVDCSIEKLIERDTKGLYSRAFLPDEHPDKITNLTGINDQFDIPLNPDLYINTGEKSLHECANNLYQFILFNENLIAYSNAS